MVTWPMTSRDLERSRSRPNYLWAPISGKGLEIGAWSQGGTNRKWRMGNPMVTWPMTSRDLERSASWPQNVWGPLSHMSDNIGWPQNVKIVSQIYLSANILKRQEIKDQFQWTSSRNWLMANRLVTQSMTSHDLVKRAPRRLYQKRDGIGQTSCSYERYLVVDSGGNSVFLWNLVK